MYIINVLDSACSTDVKNGVLEIPEGVDQVNTNAISKIDNLKKIVVPASMKNFQDEAICCCPNLETIVLKGKYTIFTEKATKNCPKLKTLSIPEGCPIYEPQFNRKFLPGIRVDQPRKEYSRQINFTKHFSR